MDPTNLTRIRDVMRNHRAMLDELESFLEQGEIQERELVVAAKGIVVSAAFLNELVSQQASGSATNGDALRAKIEAVTDQPEN